MDPRHDLFSFPFSQAPRSAARIPLRSSNSPSVPITPLYHQHGLFCVCSSFHVLCLCLCSYGHVSGLGSTRERRRRPAGWAWLWIPPAGRRPRKCIITCSLVVYICMVRVGVCFRGVCARQWRRHTCVVSCERLWRHRRLCQQRCVIIGSCPEFDSC